MSDARPVRAGQTEIVELGVFASTSPVFPLQGIDDPSASQQSARNPSCTWSFESVHTGQDLKDEWEIADKEGGLSSDQLDYNHVVDFSWTYLSPHVAQFETPPSHAWSTSSGTRDRVPPDVESAASLLGDSPITDFSSTDSGTSSTGANDAGSNTDDYYSNSSDSLSESTVVGRNTGTSTPERADKQTTFTHNAEVGVVISPPKELETGSCAHGALVEPAASEKEFLNQFFSVPIIQARLDRNTTGRRAGRAGKPSSVDSLVRRWLAARGSKSAAAKAADAVAPYFASASLGGRLPLLGSAALLQLAHDANNPLVSVREDHTSVTLPHSVLSFCVCESLSVTASCHLQ
jgi:hypothetical protein